MWFFTGGNFGGHYLAKNFDHSLGGWITPLVIVGVACALIAVNLSRSPLVRYYLCATGTAYCFSGIAHFVLYLYHTSGKPMGQSFEESNSEWMYFWIIGAACYPLGYAGMVSVVGKATRCHKLLGYGAWGIGFVLAYYEVYIFGWTENLEYTGWYGHMFSAISSEFCVILVIINFISKGCQCSCGLCTIFCGLCLHLCGMGVVLKSPGGCRMNPQHDCPYPSGFNVYSVFHLFVIGSMISITMGAMNLMEEAKEPEE
jgi:hypothetical protein